LLAGPEHHILVLGEFVEDPLEVFDAVRHAGDLGMDRDRYDTRRSRAFGVKAFELIHRPIIEFSSFVMLDHHHRYVVQLDGVGNGLHEADREGLPDRLTDWHAMPFCRSANGDTCAWCKVADFMRDATKQ